MMNATHGLSGRSNGSELIPTLGHDLHAAFVRAALPPPTMEMSALIQGPTEQIAYVEMIAGFAITMAPAMEKEGIVAPAVIDPATFPRRMREEVEQLAGVAIGRSEIGAWSRKPTSR